MRKLKDIIKNKQAIAPIWAVAACTIIFTPIIFIFLGMVLDEVAATMFATYTLTGYPLAAWTLVKALISAIPLFILVTVVIWAAVNSKLRGEE